MIEEPEAEDSPFGDLSLDEINELAEEILDVLEHCNCEEPFHAISLALVYLAQDYGFDEHDFDDCLKQICGWSLGTLQAVKRRKNGGLQ